jgi:hypothetical protein
LIILENNDTMRKKLKYVLAAAWLISSPYVAADTISLQGFYGGNATGTITATGVTNYFTGATNVSFSEGAGIGSFSTLNVTTDQTFQSWCIDIFHNFSWGNPSSTTNTLVSASSLFGQSKATQMGQLYTEYMGIQNASSSNLYNPAFQVALWAIVTNTSNTAQPVLGTYFNTSNTAVNNEAATLLSDLSTTKSLYTASVWSVQNNSVSSNGLPTWGAQDIAVFTSPVPEPATWGMLLAGLGLLGFTACRKKSA